MNQIIKKHWRYLAFAILFTAISSLAAVYLQFIKGDVLDFALAKNSPAALRSGILLLLLIVVENSFWYFFRHRGKQVLSPLRAHFAGTIFFSSDRPEFPPISGETPG